MFRAFRFRPFDLLHLARCVNWGILRSYTYMTMLSGASQSNSKRDRPFQKGVHHLHTGLRVTARSSHDPTASPQGAVSPQTGPFTENGATSPSNLYFLLRNYNSPDSPYLSLCERSLPVGFESSTLPTGPFVGKPTSVKHFRFAGPMLRDWPIYGDALIIISEGVADIRLVLLYAMEQRARGNVILFWRARLASHMTAHIAKRFYGQRNRWLSSFSRSVKWLEVEILKATLSVPFLCAKYSPGRPPFPRTSL